MERRMLWLRPHNCSVSFELESRERDSSTGALRFPPRVLPEVFGNRNWKGKDCSGKLW
jgi:hypothetical protein